MAPANSRPDVPDRSMPTTASGPRVPQRLSISATAITVPAAAEEAQEKSITPMKTHSAGVSSFRSHVSKTKTTTITGAAAAIDQIHHLDDSITPPNLSAGPKRRSILSALVRLWEAR
jgi:hypothetical protein